jgi:hypothetical protein
VIAKSLLGALLGVALSAQSAPEPPIGTDGHHLAPLTESSHRFRCGEVGAELRWRQERLDPGSVPRLRDALRVTLLEFSAPGRSLSASDLDRVRELFGSFAWVETARAWCDRRGIEVWLTVMPADDWVAYIEETRAERPPTRLRTVRISATGAVVIDGPGA